MKYKNRSASFVLGALLLASSNAFASILPPNDLHLEDNPEIFADITKEEFDKIIDDMVTLYRPLAALHGAKLESSNGWSDSTVNASANRMGNTWFINMYGGLARRAEVSKDGFALVVCHELGHHFGGFPFKGGISNGWAADEGQSDYFATQGCARKAWKNEKDLNATFATRVAAFEKERCDGAWSSEDDRNLCYRIAAAGESLGGLLAALKKSPMPSYETPDQKRVFFTNHSHPDAQCRMDTYLAGAVCPAGFPDELIPARGHRGGQWTRSAEVEALKYSCSPVDALAFAQRPRCWFGPKVR
jgi:hypothetical protein